MQIIWSYEMHLTKHWVAEIGIRKSEFVAKTQFILEPIKFRLSVAVLWIYNKYCKSMSAKHENHEIVLEFRGIVRNYAEYAGLGIALKKSTCVGNLIIILCHKLVSQLSCIYIYLVYSIVYTTHMYQYLSNLFYSLHNSHVSISI